MGVMSWLHSKFGCASGPAQDKADVAIDSASDAIRKSRSIRAQLEPYKDSPDPFFEVFRKTTVAKMFEAHIELDTPRARME